MAVDGIAIVEDQITSKQRQVLVCLAEQVVVPYTLVQGAQAREEEGSGGSGDGGDGSDG